MRMGAPPAAATMAIDPEIERDRQAMRRLAEGHEAALDELMECHAGRLCGYLKRVLDSDEDAEDLAQEVFVRVYQHRARYDPARPFAAWLYAIAGNLVRDRFRWRSRHAEVSLEALSGEGGEAPVISPTGPAVATVQGPDGELVRGEEAGAVRDAVRALPPDLREVLVLSEFEERTHQEIGEILGCTAKAVEMKLYRARGVLKKRLAKWLS